MILFVETMKVIWIENWLEETQSLLYHTLFCVCVSLLKLHLKKVHKRVKTSFYIKYY